MDNIAGPAFPVFDRDSDESNCDSFHNVVIEKVIFVLVDKIRNEIDVEHSLKVLHKFDAPAELYEKYKIVELIEKYLVVEHFKNAATKLLNHIIQRREDAVREDALKTVLTTEENKEKLIELYVKCLENKTLVNISLHALCDMNLSIEQYEVNDICTLAQYHYDDFTALCHHLMYDYEVKFTERLIEWEIKEEEELKRQLETSEYDEYEEESEDETNEQDEDESSFYNFAEQQEENTLMTSYNSEKQCLLKDEKSTQEGFTGSVFSVNDYDVENSKYDLFYYRLLELVIVFLLEKIKDQVDIEYSLVVLYNINAPAQLYDKYRIEDVAEHCLAVEHFKRPARKLLDRIFQRRADPGRKPVPRTVERSKTINREKFIKFVVKCLKNKLFVKECLVSLLKKRLTLVEYQKHDIYSLAKQYRKDKKFSTPAYQLILLYKRRNFKSQNEHRRQLIIMYVSYIRVSKTFVNESLRALLGIKMEAREYEEFDIVSLALECFEIDEYMVSANNLLDHYRKRQAEPEVDLNPSSEVQALWDDGIYGLLTNEQILLTSTVLKKFVPIVNPPSNENQPVIDVVDNTTYEKYIHQKNQYCSNWINDCTSNDRPFQRRMFSLFDFDDVAPNPANIHPTEVVRRNDGSESSSELEDVTSEIMKYYQKPKLESNEVTIDDDNTMHMNQIYQKNQYCLNLTNECTSNDQPLQRRMFSLFDFDDVPPNPDNIRPSEVVLRNGGSESSSELEDVTSEIMRYYQLPTLESNEVEDSANHPSCKRTNTEEPNMSEPKQAKIEPHQ